MRRNNTTRHAHQKVRILAGVLLSVVAILVGVAAVGLIDTEDVVETLVEADLPSKIALDDLDRELLEAELSIEQAFLLTDSGERFKATERYERSVTRARSKWSAFRASAGDLDPELRRIVIAYETLNVAWIDSADELTEAARSDSPLSDDRTRETLNLTRRRFDSMRQFSTKLKDDYYEPALTARAPHALSRVRTTLLWVLVTGGFGICIAFVVARSTVRATVAQQREIDARDGLREVDARRNEQESRLHHALEMARDEEAAIGTIGMALRELRSATLAELLVADSSHAHVRRALTTDDEGRGPGCGVGTPNDCPAVARGQTLTFADSTKFDTCPQLRDRGISPCTAICVPVSIMGAAAGVLHAIGPIDAGDRSLVDDLEQIATKAGERIGLLRAFSRSEAQASTDSLTGLATRRNLEEQVATIERNRVPYAVAFGDLDHFKQLNDVYGHETGDRALRLFARTLRDSIRPTDIAGRWGGEEFVVVLPHTTASEAVGVLERIRESLALALATGSTPAFTVSFGVGDFEDADTFGDRVGSADQALLAAKRAGRNRVVVASAATLNDADTPVEVSP